MSIHPALIDTFPEHVDAVDMPPVYVEKPPARIPAFRDAPDGQGQGKNNHPKRWIRAMVPLIGLTCVFGVC